MPVVDEAGMRGATLEKSVRRSILAFVAAGLLVLFMGTARAGAAPVLVTGMMADTLSTDASLSGTYWGLHQVLDPNTHEVWQFKSLPSFRAAAIPAGAVVMYDLENWTASPTEEITHVEASLKRFVSIAHARGLVAMLAPSRSVIGQSVTCVRRSREPVAHRYLRCVASIPTDFLLVQSQSLQCDTAAFAALISSVAARQSGQVIAEMSVTRLACASVAQLQADTAAVQSVADGVAVWSFGNNGHPLGAGYDDQVSIITDYLKGVR